MTPKPPAVPQLPVAPVPSDKAAHGEAFGPYMLLSAMNGRQSTSFTSQEKKWAAAVPKAWNTGSLLGAGSKNIPIINAAANVWLGGAGASEARAWLLDTLRYQTGEVNPLAGQESAAFFGNDETTSTTYWPFCAGAFASLRVMAQRFPGNPLAPEVLRLTGRYLEITAAILALGAVPWPSDPEYKNRGNDWWYDGPTVPATGQRSTTAHPYQNDLGPILSRLVGWPLKKSKHEDWPARIVASALSQPQVSSAAILRTFIGHDGPDPLPGVLPLLTGVKLAVETHWLRYPSGLYVWQARRINYNTQNIPASRALNASRHMDYLNPWVEPGADPNFSDARGGAQGDCITAIEGGWLVSRAEGREVAYKLPQEPALWHVVADQGGFRMA